MSVIHLPPPKPVTINEVAAIDFDALYGPETPPPDDLKNVDFAARLAHQVAIRSKAELVALVLQAGPDDTQLIVDHIRPARERLTAMAEVMGAMESRLMIAMAVAAQG